jgi:hypothetical protein
MMIYTCGSPLPVKRRAKLSVWDDPAQGKKGFLYWPKKRDFPSAPGILILLLAVKVP